MYVQTNRENLEFFTKQWLDKAGNQVNLTLIENKVSTSIY